jgi:hypothetical protein
MRFARGRMGSVRLPENDRFNRVAPNELLASFQDQEREEP